MFDILVFVLENYPPEGRPGPAALARRLAALGFDADEIGRALEWLEGLDRSGEAGFRGQPRPGAHRVFAESEATRIPADCRGLLAFLEQAGAIDPLTRELIVDHAIAAADATDDAVLTLEKFKVIVLMVMWRRQLPFDNLVFENFLDDDDAPDRLLMH